jgi:hypothetical protein
MGSGFSWRNNLTKIGSTIVNFSILLADSCRIDTAYEKS